MFSVSICEGVPITCKLQGQNCTAASSKPNTTKSRANKTSFYMNCAEVVFSALRIQGRALRYSSRVKTYLNVEGKIGLSLTSAKGNKFRSASQNCPVSIGDIKSTRKTASETLPMALSIITKLETGRCDN